MRPRLPGRSRRSLAVLVVALLAVGAFFARGPIGLGNGPLKFLSFSGTTLQQAKPAPVALVMPVINPGKSPVVINGVTLVGGKGFPAPRLVSAHGAHDVGCAALELASQTAQDGCATGELTLAGLTIPPSHRVYDKVTQQQVAVSSLAVVAVAAPPPARGCWTMKAIAVHYRIGIRHYTATAPEAGAVCGTGVSAAARAAAMASLG
jgi:hypothetical protein